MEGFGEIMTLKQTAKDSKTGRSMFYERCYYENLQPTVNIYEWYIRIRGLMQNDSI